MVKYKVSKKIRNAIIYYMPLEYNFLPFHDINSGMEELEHAIFLPFLCH
jgi:hypothetical protein